MTSSFANVARLLKKMHCNVQVLMTQNATNFINPITFESLTGNKCLIDTFDRNFQYSVEHVALAKQADVVLVAPASANVIGKIACMQHKIHPVCLGAIHNLLQMLQLLCLQR